MQHLSSDCLASVLSFLTAGVWHAPARFVCRRWRTLLGGCPLLQPPGAAYAECIARRNGESFDWLRSVAAPCHASACLAAVSQGQIDALDWFRRREPGIWAGMGRRIRISLARAVITGGGLHGMRALRHQWSEVHRSLNWGPATQAFGVKHYAALIQGDGGGAAEEHWAAVWPELLALCGGQWHGEAACAALHFGGPVVVGSVLAHPDALVWCVDRAHWERLVGEAAGNLHYSGALAVVAALRPRAWLPWSALTIAALQGLPDNIRTFLAHPQCPPDRQSPAASASSVAAILGAHGGAAAPILDDPRRASCGWMVAGGGTLARAGIPWSDELLMTAVEVSPLDLVRWLVQHPASAGLVRTQPVLLVRAIVGNRFDMLRFLLEEEEGSSPPGASACVREDAIYAATAAEMGCLEILQHLRITHQCAWDHRVVWYSLANNHLRLARWAILSGCPLVPDTPDGDGGGTAGLRDVLMGHLW